MARGVTILEGPGDYTRDAKEVFYIVISQQEMVTLRNIVSKIDDEAYVTVNNVHEMLGKGYEAATIKKKRFEKTPIK